MLRAFLIFGNTYLPTKQQQEAGVDRQERYRMDEYEERTLSVIAPEQEVRFLVPAGQAHLVPVLTFFEIQNSSESERVCEPSSSDPVLSAWGPSWSNCPLNDWPVTGHHFVEFRGVAASLHRQNSDFRHFHFRQRQVLIGTSAL